MKKNIIFILLNFINLILFSQSDIITKSYTTEQFNAISIHGNFEVSITSGSSPSIKMNGKPAQLKNINLFYEENTLIIQNKLTIKNKKNETDKIKIFISKDTLQSILASGNNKINMKGDFTSTNDLFTLSTLGDSSSIVFYGSIKTNKLATSINGNGLIEINVLNNMDKFNANLIGKGNLICKNLISSNSELVINGMGNILIQENSFFENLHTNILNHTNSILKNEASIIFQSNIKNRICNNLNISINGKGNIDLVGLETKYAEISILGMGNVKVFTIEKINATINGIGNIKYKGQPKIKLSTLNMSNIDPID